MGGETGTHAARTRQPPLETGSKPSMPREAMLHTREATQCSRTITPSPLERGLDSALSSHAEDAVRHL